MTLLTKTTEYEATGSFSYKEVSVSVHVIMTDGRPRLAFRTRELAEEYLKSRNEILSKSLVEGTTIQSVYLETLRVPID